ncbi:hypothetical protein Bca101_068551 [Brassica carinata]
MDYGNFQCASISGATQDDLVDYRCSAEDASILMKPVLETEIKDTLFSMRAANKAPGPDEFPMEFIE